MTSKNKHQFHYYHHHLYPTSVFFSFCAISVSWRIFCLFLSAASTSCSSAGLPTPYRSRVHLENNNSPSPPLVASLSAKNVLCADQWWIQTRGRIYWWRNFSVTWYHQSHQYCFALINFSEGKNIQTQQGSKRYFSRADMWVITQPEEFCLNYLNNRSTSDS